MTTEKSPDELCSTSAFELATLVRRRQASPVEIADAVELYEVPGGAIPHIKLYDRTGKLRHSLAAADIEAELIEQRIKELLAEPAP